MPYFKYLRIHRGVQMYLLLNPRLYLSLYSVTTQLVIGNFPFAKHTMILCLIVWLQLALSLCRLKQQLAILYANHACRNIITRIKSIDMAMKHIAIYIAIAIQLYIHGSYMHETCTMHAQLYIYRHSQLCIIDKFLLQLQIVVFSLVNQLLQLQPSNFNEESLNFNHVLANN